MKVAQKFKKEADFIRNWTTTLKEVKVAFLKTNKYFGVEALHEKCEKMSKLSPLFFGQWEKCDFDVVIAILSGLHVFDKDDFSSVVKKTVPSASNDYIDEKWTFFLAMPIQYIYSRSPKIQGERLLIELLKVGGMDESRI